MAVRQLASLPRDQHIPDSSDQFSGIEVDEEVGAESPSTGNENSPAETSELPMLRHSTRARQAPRYLQDYEVGGIKLKNNSNKKRRNKLKTMATLMKLRHMPLLQRCVWNHCNKVSRSISTSKKNSDSASSACESTTEQDKNWVSYGFDYTSKEEDTNAHHASFFFSVTLCLVFGSFAWAYAPDLNLRDWSQREAFLELRRREKAGLPPIDPNFINPKYVKLPSESELCDVEIII
ncbi:hypothetical protein K1T71_003926 [Dendrolimus kikuchii]|uniref:Uncharacterized protein n=1 Tax=Dendrolimus kikuchii TaxID=765133 RepID=A0ACC1DAB9_9NEOP|nr:hypothetical protein K1T71_003926 [Dendrolimus kikuchii]